MLKSGIKKLSIISLLTFLLFPSFTLAYSDYIIAGGNNIGIELSTNGIIIAGTYKVNDQNPALDAGLKPGDIIKSINGKKVTSIEEMTNIINSSSDKNISIKYLRNNKEKDTTLNLVYDNNQYKTGLYVKDSIFGIGTISYIDPNTKIYGALGHEITDKTTKKIIDTENGKIYDSTVTSIHRSSNGTPGEKTAKFDANNILGNISENTIHGIFGTYNDIDTNEKLYKVANPSEIKTGDAQILTVLDGKSINAYDISILKIDNSSSTKNILFQVTDKELLKTSGGIVQGMSGSPIIQGDNIIGAVTHVVIDNPEKGYGIFITNMLEEGEN